jgi:hypothetical protein
MAKRESGDVGLETGRRGVSRRSVLKAGAAMAIIPLLGARGKASRRQGPRVVVGARRSSLCLVLVLSVWSVCLKCHPFVGGTRNRTSVAGVRFALLPSYAVVRPRAAYYHRLQHRRCAQVRSAKNP